MQNSEAVAMRLTSDQRRLRPDRSGLRLEGFKVLLGLSAG